MNESLYDYSFVDAVQSAKSLQTSIGSGNPNSTVLIIGKERSDDENSDLDLVWRGEAEKWGDNILNNVQQSDLPKSFFTHVLMNPLFPFKGQVNKIERRNSVPFGGTSTTWANYQKLYDIIFNEGKKSFEIDFFKKFFVTELNDNPSRYSHLQDKARRKRSIESRLAFLEKTDFYQQFPVVIIACGHYVRDNQINICKTFGVKFVETIHVGGDPKQWINIHLNEDGGKRRLVIHTLQLSINIRQELLEEIGVRAAETLFENQ